MKRTICPRCGMVMYDMDEDIRFRCRFCKYQFDVKKETKEKLKEALRKDDVEPQS